MNKKLIYYWYVPAEWDKVYDLHLKNIKLYIPHYDFKEKLFVISYDKGNYTVPMYVLTVLEKIREIVPDAKFVFYDNDPVLRDSKYFYNEIAMKLGEFDKDDVIFYAHAKGKYSNYVSQFERDLWVNLMYFGNLFNKSKLESFIEDPDKVCFGTITTTFEIIEVITAFKESPYKWFYGGTFLWFKPYSLYEEMKRNNLVFPNNSRYFCEAFIGYTVPFDERKVVANLGVRKHDSEKSPIIRYVNAMPEEDRKQLVKINNMLISNDIQEIR